MLSDTAVLPIATAFVREVGMIPAEIREWLGRVASIEGVELDFEAAAPRGRELAACRVWSLPVRGNRSDERATWFVKVHPARRSHRQEERAYRDWASRLPDETPRLIASEADRLALITAGAVGVPADAPKLSSADRVELHRRAGAFLRRWHALSHVDDDPLPFDRAIARRAESWGELTNDEDRGIDAHDVDFVRGLIRDHAALFRSAKRVPCHLDFTEANWLVAPDGGLTVIDFEHARPDYFLSDVVRLHVGSWRTDPELADAWWTGYGRRPSVDDHRRIDVLAAHWGLATQVWALRNGDPEFERLGSDTVNWIRSRV